MDFSTQSTKIPFDRGNTGTTKSYYYQKKNRGHEFTTDFGDCFLLGPALIKKS